jgi:hypothetical protein
VETPGIDEISTTEGPSNSSMDSKKGRDTIHSRDADNRRENNNNRVNTGIRRDVNKSRTPATAGKSIAA